MNMDKLRQAHESELQEAGIKPGVLIQPDKLVEAVRAYQKLTDSSAFYSGTSHLLKENGAEKEAQDSMTVAAYGAAQRVIGAQMVLKAMGFHINQTDIGVDR